MGYETIIAERRDAVGVVTLLAGSQRPEHAGRRRAGRRARRLRCQCHGGDRTFAAGADIKEMQDKTYPSTYVNDFLTDWAIAGLRKLLIAAVAGYALGGGGRAGDDL